MRLLLDTHVYLWWLVDDPRLGERARGVLADPAIIVHVSAATIWEISIKYALGRLEIEEADLVAEITANGFVELPVAAAHAWHAGQLPQHHDDPFDRLLIAQALREQLHLVTADTAIADYDVRTMPA